MLKRKRHPEAPIPRRPLGVGPERDGDQPSVRSTRGSIDEAIQAYKLATFEMAVTNIEVEITRVFAPTAVVKIVVEYACREDPFDLHALAIKQASSSLHFGCTGCLQVSVDVGESPTPSNITLCALCRALHEDVKTVVTERGLQNLGGSGGGTQGSLSPKSLAVLLITMWRLGASICSTASPAFIDAGHGDGRVLLCALHSGLFKSAVGVDIMDGPECWDALSVWATRKGVVTKHLRTFYGQLITDLTDLEWTATLVSPQDSLRDTHVFSFMQGWKTAHVDGFITWVCKVHPCVVVIVGHARGIGAIVSSQRLTETWSRMTGYVLRQSLKVSMAGSGGSVTACCFVRI
jgi:hypothetical protein